jgi:hypothetical protein
MDTLITIVYNDQSTREFTTNQDYESIVFWAREVVEYNTDTIKCIVVNFDEGKMIFESIY